MDGEHYPEVVRDALDRLAGEHDLRGVLFMGGQEKVGPLVLEDPARHYGRDVAISPDDPAGALRELAASAGLEAVVDLSGEPVLDGRARSGLASLALHLGLEYRSPGLHLAPPRADSLVEELRAGGELPDVVAAIEDDDTERALELIVEAVPNASPEERDRLREVAVALFERLGQEDPVTVGYRRRLASALY